MKKFAYVLLNKKELIEISFEKNNLPDAARGEKVVRIKIEI